MLAYAIALALIILCSLLIVRIGTVALRLTGLDKDIASFQSISAFTGTGFTTAESDMITKHPGRKTTVKILMIVGNIYFASVVAMIISAVVSTRDPVWETALIVTLMIVGVITLAWLGFTRRISRWLDHYIEKRLARLGGYKIYQIQRVLDLAGGYTVAEFRVKRGSWLAGRTLADLGLARRNILVLAVERGLRLIRSPDGSTLIEESDNLICYGPVDGLKLLETGPAAAGAAPETAPGPGGENPPAPKEEKKS